MGYSQKRQRRHLSSAILRTVALAVDEPVLSVRRLEKVYPNGTVALKDANFDVAAATVHGLIGANGAGKSTLIKILSGAISASSGEIIWRGERRDWCRPADAAAAGIATIHQHIPLAGTLSVRENVFLASTAAVARLAPGTRSLRRFAPGARLRHRSGGNRRRSPDRAPADGFDPPGPRRRCRSSDHG